MSHKKLLILDLDETLIHSSNQPLAYSCDFEIEDYFVYQRPYLKEFLEAVSKSYRLAIWSSAVEYYVLGIVSKLAENLPMLSIQELEFLWGRSHCTARSSQVNKDGYFLKDLDKVKGAGYKLESVLIVEDESRKVHKHYENAIFIEPYLGDTKDGELERLAKYLEKIKAVDNVTELEKRFWDREV